MRKVYLCLIASGIGFLGTVLMPIPSFKVFAYLIPAIILSIVLSARDKRFNLNVLMAFLIIGMLLSSSFVTFDASQTLNMVLMMKGISNIMDKVGVFFFIGLPLIMFVAVIILLWTQKYSKAIKLFVRLIAILGTLLVVFYLLDFTGIKLFGMTDTILDFYATIGRVLFSLPERIYNLGGAALGGLGGGAEIEKLPTDFDAFQVHFNSMSYQEIIYAVNDLLPIFVSIIALVIAIPMAKKEWEEKLITSFSKKGELERLKERIEEKSEDGKTSILEETSSTMHRVFGSANLNMMLYLTAIGIIAFALFFSYANVYPVASDAQNWRYIGYFGIYMVLIVICFLGLNFFSSISYKHTDSFIDGCMGVLYGLFGLFLTTRLFTASAVMDAYSADNLSADIVYLINQFIFVAPAETLMFHVFLPSLFVALIFRRSGKIAAGQAEEVLHDEILESKILIEIYRNKLSYYKKTDNKDAIKKHVNAINELTEKKALLDNAVIDFGFSLDSVFKQKDTFVLFIVVIIISNFLFSLMHFFVISNTITFFQFWTSGLGIIYFSGGCWFTFVHYRWGWMPAILVHALHNTSTIILTLFAVGMI